MARGSLSAICVYVLLSRKPLGRTRNLRAVCHVLKRSVSSEPPRGDSCCGQFYGPHTFCKCYKIDAVRGAPIGRQRANHYAGTRGGRTSLPIDWRPSSWSFTSVAALTRLWHICHLYVGCWADRQPTLTLQNTKQSVAGGWRAPTLLTRLVTSNFTIYLRQP